MVFVTNSIFLIFPSKWSTKTQRFQCDATLFKNACRILHLNRASIGILIFLIYLHFLKEYLTYVDLLFICVGLILCASASMHILICNSPDVFSTLFKALVQVNRNCGKYQIHNYLLLLCLVVNIILFISETE